MKWCTVGPLLWPNTIDGMDLPIVWGEGVQLDVLPEWALEDDVVGVLSLWQRERLEQGSLALIQCYDADALGASDPEWKGGEGRSLQERAEERMHFFILASWLARPLPMTVELIIHASDPGNISRWRIDSISQVGRTEPGPFDGSGEPGQGSIQQSRELFAAIDGLPRSGPVWIALWTLWIALQEGKPGEVRILLLWIAIEALFGPEDGRKISHRLAQRMASFLAAGGEEAHDLYREIKKGYGLRSKIVHGMKVKNPDPETGDRRLGEVQGWLRRSLCRILSCREAVETFSGKGRERFLDEMTFG